MIRALVPLLCICSLSACATTSFAPPEVPVRLADGGPLSGDCGGLRSAGRKPVQITADVAGALRYVDSHLQAYDCSAQEAANGRQGFEVPAFLLATGAIAAAAFGAGPNVAIAAGAGGSVLNGGKAYYDPKLKAQIYTHAVDALLCIRMEAVGMPSFAAMVDQAKQEKTGSGSVTGAGIVGDGGTVEVTTDIQYFNMVTGAVGFVRSALGTRLSNVGTFDPAGVSAEMEKAIAAIQAAQEAKKKQTPNADPTARDALLGMTTDFGAAAEFHHVVQLDLAELQPKLDRCVARAKM